MKIGVAFVVLVFSLTQNSALCQDTSTVKMSRNSFYIEVGGNAGGYYLPELFSLNYDHLLYNGRSLKTSIRVGSNIPRIIAPAGGIWSTHNIPLMFNFLFGRRNLKFETGMGYVLHYVNLDYKTAYGGFTGVLGLRYQMSPKGLIARTGFTLTIASEPRGLFIGPKFGLSIGYSL